MSPSQSIRNGTVGLFIGNAGGTPRTYFGGFVCARQCEPTDLGTRPPHCVKFVRTSGGTHLGEICCS